MIQAGGLYEDMSDVVVPVSTVVMGLCGRRIGTDFVYFKIIRSGLFFFFFFFSLKIDLRTKSCHPLA